MNKKPKEKPPKPDLVRVGLKISTDTHREMRIAAIEHDVTLGEMVDILWAWNKERAKS